MEQFKEIIETLNSSKFFLFLLILIVGIVAVRIIQIFLKKLILKTKLDHTVKSFLYSLIRVVMYFIVVIVALSTVGVDVTSMVTAMGAALLAACLSLQNTLSNFVSGIILLVSKPFTAGDLIEFEGYEGYVDNIRIFYTSIHTFDNKIVRIPNFKLTSNNVANCSVGENRRVTVKTTVSYDDNITKVKSVIFDVIAKNELIIPEPESKVYVSNHLDSGVEITIFVWTKQENYYPVLFYMEEHVKLAFDENGITIPYPHVVVKN